MFAISFRIPLEIFGTSQTFNGSALYHEYLKPGTTISVADKLWGLSYEEIDAEVIQSVSTKRAHDSFNWDIV